MDSEKNHFKLKSSYKPTGGQPFAIEQLTNNLKNEISDQTLLGVTGSGKTFVMANVIEEIQKPTLIISHNKTLAAQLYQEFRDFFPNNAVEYFVSYYDYYQPESYLPATDTYIEKDSDINEEIDKLRLSTTASLLTRNDVIVVASVSCIYNLGSPIEYQRQIIKIINGMKLRQSDLLQRLTQLYYERNDYDFKRGTFRVKGDTVDIHPAYQHYAIRVEFIGDKVQSIKYFDPVSGEYLIPSEINVRNESGLLTGEIAKLTKAQEDFGKDRIDKNETVVIYPAKHYVAPEERYEEAIKAIQEDLNKRLIDLNKQGRKLEAYRLEQRTNYDIEMIQEIGYCKGIENYSRYFDGRKEGDPPYSLLDYFVMKDHINSETEFTEKWSDKLELNNSKNNDFLLIIDESHITIPQIRGMYNGDRSRKQTLVDYGFRLPSALDNRPLKFDEFERRMGRTIYTSATPSEWELSRSEIAYRNKNRNLSGNETPKEDTYESKEDKYESRNEIDEKKIIGSEIVERGKIRNENRDKELIRNEKRDGVIELIIRPTGLIDPEITVLPTKGQIEDLEKRISQRVESKQRVLVTTLTKRMSEELSDFLNEKGYKVAYLHSDIETLERTDILDNLRKGEYDVLVGINLLREGLDLPEVSLVAILDADKEGFLRSETSLIQTMGRAARHIQGEVVMYADKITQSMQKAIDEVARRRKIQLSYNKQHNITPQTINKPIRDRILEKETKIQTLNIDEMTMELYEYRTLNKKQQKEIIKKLESKMKSAAELLDFETAATIRDRIKELKKN